VSEIDRRHLCGGANGEGRRTDENANLFPHFVVFCSGSRVGCDGGADAGGTPAATVEESRP
jgi:hypothetical protein